MKDQIAQQLLAKVMNWADEEAVLTYVPALQLLADYKYDHYQRFGPGRRFIESLALWLNQFDSADRDTAFRLVMDHLVFISDNEIGHLVQMAYPDVIVQERIRLIAEEQGIAPHRVAAITRDRRFEELRLKSIYLGLSDGAHTSELRRASNGEIGNEQIWQAYELGDDKSSDMVKELSSALSTAGFVAEPARFNIVWLLDDFSGSGNTYIRYDAKSNRFKGKIARVYDQLQRGHIVDTTHHEVYLLLYVATRQAIDHIEYWAEQFTSEYGYKPLQVHALHVLEREISLAHAGAIVELIKNPKYYDEKSSDKHIEVGGTKDATLGFAACALPVALGHNTPNNSVYLLWGPETSQKFFGLFPRMSRHREF